MSTAEQPSGSVLRISNVLGQTIDFSSERAGMTHDFEDDDRAKAPPTSGTKYTGKPKKAKPSPGSAPSVQRATSNGQGAAGSDAATERPRVVATSSVKSSTKQFDKKRRVQFARGCCQTLMSMLKPKIKRKYMKRALNRNGLEHIGHLIERAIHVYASSKECQDSSSDSESCSRLDSESYSETSD